jgi:hypothetical protein
MWACGGSRLITPEDIGEASREVVHATILPLTMAFVHSASARID